MSTTIDSLQIEIQSNSTNAASGIEGLAKALKKLSKNSDISNAVTNLNNLRKSLHAFVNMPSNASKIESLAKSMQALKKVGKIELGNSLDTVQRAMKSLGAVNVDDVKPKIEEIARALTPLNNVKASGFKSAIDGLKNLDKAVDGMDAGSLDRFVDKIAELDKKLAPVSKKLVAIGNAFKGVNTTSIAAGSGLGTFRTHINATAMNLTNFISVAQTAISALQPLINVLQTAIGDALEWDGIEYQFGNAFGEQADEYYKKITEITDALKINKQTFMEISAMSTSMLKGFGVNSADARTMGLGYAELTYDIWAAYNNKYKTLKDASDAISSAIAGEVEPVRRAGFTIVESQLEITAANHGVAYSAEKATEAQKSYLRYLTLVDQAHIKGIVGAYASEMDTAEGAVRTFTQQLKTLSQTFGSVFLPILVKVMPWLTAFVELIGDAIIAIAGLFGVNIQKVDFSDSYSGITAGADEAANSVGNVTDGVKDTTKALEDLKNATIGIDELNVISPPSSSDSESGGSGAGTGGAGWDSLDVGSLWDKKIWEDVQTQVDEIKEKIKGLLPVIGGIATAFAGWKLSKLLTDFDDVAKKLGKLEPAVKNLAKGLAIAGISVAVGKLTWDFTGAYLENGNLGDLAKMLGTTALGAAVAAWLKGPKGAGIVMAVSGVVTLGRLIFDVSEGNVDISDPQALVTGLVGSLETILGGAMLIDALRGGKWTKSIGNAISNGLQKAFGGTTFAWITTSLKAKIGTALTGVGTALAGMSGWALAAVAAIAGLLVLAIVDYDFTEIGRKVGEKVGNAVRVMSDWAKEIGKHIKEAFNSATEWVKEELKGRNPIETILFFILELPIKALAKFGEIGGNIVEGIFEGIGEKLENLWGNITEFVDGFIQGFKDGFEINSPSKKFIEIGEQLIAGLLDPFNFSSIKEKLSSFWDSVTGFFGGNKSDSEEVKVDVKLVKGGWTTIKSWIGSIPGVSQAVSLVKSGWSTIKKWIGSTTTISQAIKLVKSGWTSVKTWVGSIPTVYQAVGLAKSGWSSIKGWIGSIPTMSVPMKLVKSGWTTIKNWLGNLNFKINFSLPRIGVNWGSTTVAGFKISYPTGFYTYKNGGFPDIGELFIAREAGPEMVGKIGSKTTVANNEQIVEAVSEGVYTAVVAAMAQSEGNGGQSFNIYLDGRQLVSTIEKRQRERGATIMRNGVYAY